MNIATTADFQQFGVSKVKLQRHAQVREDIPNNIQEVFYKKYFKYFKTSSYPDWVCVKDIMKETGVCRTELQDILSKECYRTLKEPEGRMCRYYPKDVLLKTPYYREVIIRGKVVNTRNNYINLYDLFKLNHTRHYSRPFNSYKSFFTNTDIIKWMCDQKYMTRNLNIPIQYHKFSLTNLIKVHNLKNVVSISGVGVFVDLHIAFKFCQFLGVAITLRELSLPLSRVRMCESSKNIINSTVPRKKRVKSKITRSKTSRSQSSKIYTKRKKISWITKLKNYFFKKPLFK